MANMVKQRGFASGLVTILIYGAIIGAVLSAIWWVVDEWREGRAAQKEVEAAFAHVSDCPALERDKGLAACVAWQRGNFEDCVRKYDVALSNIAKQEEAIAKWQAAAKEANATAKAALEEAGRAHASTQTERERLARLQTEFKATGKCPAGEALMEVRKGFRP